MLLPAVARLLPSVTSPSLLLLAVEFTDKHWLWELRHQDPGEIQARGTLLKPRLGVASALTPLGRKVLFLQ